MEFRVLGSFEIMQAGENIAPTAPKPRQVAALLALRRNSVVRTSELIDELWEDDPPVSAMTTLQTYIYKLRKIFQQCGAGEILQTRPAGYMLTVPDEDLDLHWFEQAIKEGRAILDRGDPVRAAEILADALAMWRGPALVDVLAGNLLSAYVARLEEVRFRALELRIETDLTVGRHLELIGELKSLVVRYPLHEGFHTSLMTALHHCGRRYEALDVYRTLRGNLVEQLGLEPGCEARQLHQGLLSADLPAPSAAEPAAGLTRAPVEEHADDPAPARLPEDPEFAGRGTDVAEICEQVAAPPPEPCGAGRITVLSGMPGVGKTALAVHAAHRLRSAFADGQLYADLRGSTDRARDPAEVLHSFLRALGFPGQQIPEGLRDRSGLLSSAAAGRSLLMVLDDAASAAQVRPLLPGGPRCAVVVTSRRRLEGLPGARNIEIDVLNRADGIELLARIIGGPRIRRERDGAELLVDACDSLPLALRCIGDRLAAMPGYPLGRMAEELTRTPQRLPELRFGDLDLRSRFDSSYERLGDREQGAFALLSMLPAEFTADTAADLLGWDVADARRTLDHFLNHHLLRCAQENGTVRYRYPKLARMYARERLTSLVQTGADQPARSPASMA
ncbi:BTAD domain-containing putative transcriptional regulator [Actinomadura sp. 6K520]|jgi:DNA-binding SARP family transcriptional activator|uniref:AfsR/SARP family transcriptional regulator n=1 Tax=Actinomadura sp. 6K520 TaxID=2530364 RepID=UPI00104BFA06|nr:BTAD domain-containing putative transcriptional regulator [Actinomadura sp. 6K520]TDE25297.1 helix-turn-helix domain-containing protein [Actinomadura sp. 6K520]